MYLHLKKEFRFEASHQLPNHDGKCARLHGHSWVLNVWMAGHVGPDDGSPKEGMVSDYSDIKAIVQPIVDKLDHHHLGYGDVESESDGKVTLDNSMGDASFPTVPTSENILIWIAEQIMNTHPEFNWQCLELQETCTSAARLYATDWAAAHRKVVINDSPVQEITDDDIPF